jgi:hypothetical protein
MERHRVRGFVERREIQASQKPRRALSVG